MVPMVFSFVLVATFVVSLMPVSQVHAQPTAKAGTKGSVSVVPREERYNRKVFSGNEIRIGAPNNVNADCSAGPIPDIRVLTPPEHGSLRLEEIKSVIDRVPEDRRAHCNGKPIDAHGVFYKSADGYLGSDKVLIEVDFKTGTVRRFYYAIEVR